jgi:IclR family pca regulon transcriptional regulator
MPSRGPSGDPGRERYRVEALGRGLRVLTQFSEREPTLRMAQLAERTSLPMPTLFRLVATLEDEGYLERTSDGAYRPDTRVLALGFAALHGSALVHVAEGPLRALADTTKETVNLGRLTGDQVLYLIRLRNTELVTANLQVGSVLPATYGSMGKVLLADLDDEQLDATVTPRSFADRAGPNAVRSKTALREQLAQVRARGYAIQDQEVAYGLRSIAGPVRDATGRAVAAVNVAVQAAEYDVERLLAELAEPLLATCADISWRLGYRPGPAEADT